MIIFLALFSLALVIVSYMLFVKPSFAVASKCKEQLTKIKKEMAEEDKDACKLKAFLVEQKKLTKHIGLLEQDLLHGLRHSRLIPFFTDIVARYDFPVKPSYGYERSTDVQIEDYQEVFSKINILKIV